MKLLFGQLNEKITKAEKILFICHRNPDPDCIGGALALGKFVEGKNKKASYFCYDELADNFLFLNGADKFSTDKGLFGADFDLFIFIDCSEVARCGMQNVFDFKKQPWINIDHHLDIERTADLTIRDSNAAAACEIIYQFFLYNNFHFGAAIATALLAGILVDTTFLSNAATNARSVKIISELTALGGDYRKILKSFFLNKSPEVLRIWGTALARLKYDKEKDMAMTAIFKDDVKSDDRNLNEATEGFSNFLTGIIASNIVLVLKEVEGGVKGSLRTNSDGVDVSKIAAEYGGGGHRRAAGFTCPGKIVEKENEWAVEKT